MSHSPPAIHTFIYFATSINNNYLMIVYLDEYCKCFFYYIVLLWDYGVCPSRRTPENIDKGAALFI